LNGQPTAGTVARGNWNIYQFTLTASQLVKIVVNETSTGGDVDLYIKLNTVPTLYSYDYKDTSVIKNFEIDILEPALGILSFFL
jgi:hypothetical protein